MEMSILEGNEDDFTEGMTENDYTQNKSNMGFRVKNNISKLSTLCLRHLHHQRIGPNGTRFLNVKVLLYSSISRYPAILVLWRISDGAQGVWDWCVSVRGGGASGGRSYT